MRSIATLLFALVGQVTLTLLPAPAAADFDPPVDLSADGTDSANPKVAMRPAGDAYIVWQRGDFVQGRSFIAGAGFGTTQDLSTAAVTSALDPDVAMSSTGKIIAVWRALIGDDYRVQAALGVVGGALNTAETLSPAGFTATNVRAAINAKGDSIVVWEREDGRILARFRPSGGVYGPAAAVSPAGETASAPKVVIATDGSALVVWSVAASGKIKVRPRSSAGTWGAIELIDAAYSFGPDVAMTPAGNALFVWQTSSGVKARTRSAAGVHSAISPLSTSYVSNAPRVAVNAKGNALIVWATSLPTGGLPRVYIRYRSAAGALGPLQAITPANRSSFIPQVAINANGDGVIIYLADLDPNVAYGDRIVRARTRSATGTFGPPENLSVVGPNVLGADPSQLGVGMASDGSAIATWQRKDTSSGWLRIQAAVGGP